MDSALRTTLLFGITVILSSSVWADSSPTCDERSNACQCFSSKGVINLETLASPDKTPKFSKEYKDSKALVFYNPCEPFNGVEDCQEAAVCLRENGNVSGMEYNSIFGKQDNTNWTLGDENHSITYKYKYNRTFIVHLQCDEKNESAHSLVISKISGSTIEANLSSKCACFGGCPLSNSPSDEPKSGVSTGSIILILFFSLVMLYLLGGIIYNKVINGATGKELIPNVEFWLAFPRLVVDGVAFTCNCCREKRTSPGYDNV